METLNVKEVLEAPTFQGLVAKNLTAIITERSERREVLQRRAGGVITFKRDWFDSMASGELTVDFFIKSMPEIWHKRSKLSSKKRGVIEYVVGKAVHEYLQETNPNKQK